MSNRTLVQLALFASLTAISTLVLYGVYWKKQQQFLEDETKKKRAKKVIEQHSPLKSKGSPPKNQSAGGAAPTPLDLSSSVASDTNADVDTPTCSSAEKPVVTNPGQNEATEATRLYKKGEYAQAVELYTLAIGFCELAETPDPKNLKVMYSNRAAAYERMEQHSLVIDDCTRVLKMDSRHSKSYLRRAKARAAMHDNMGALVDYVCLLVLAEGRQEQLEESVANEINRLHNDITGKEIEKAKEMRRATERFLPPDFFITSYYSSFHILDDQSELHAEKSSAQYAKDLKALENDANATDSDKARLIVLKALALRDEKKYEQAEGEFEAAMAYVHPGEPAYYVAQMERGTFHHLKGEFKAAEKCFQRALNEKPESLFAKIRLGGLCFDQKKLEEAMKFFNAALEENSNSPTAYFHRGQLEAVDFSGSEDNASAAVASAVRDLEKAASLAPDFAIAYVQLGVTFARQGEFDKAIEYLIKASQVDPTAPEIYNYLGETYMQMLQVGAPGVVDVKTVEEMFEKAIEMNPSYPMAYINQGNLLVQGGGQKAMGAFELFHKAVEKCPRSKFAYCHLAQVFMAMQAYDQAIEQIDKAVPYAVTEDELQELYAIRVTAQAQLQATKMLTSAL